ncbi:hypothetical protein PF005_g25393 [Phytophthora fragariae]|uniref:RXLR phytopathogen effector protein WY-domain domain-containing protein n=1 Tax=Phytophthora fragariae TaxID=53985 RepID=A0A6A3E5A9_9STRA|nr:hypothetical protein PF003_g11457 [Phytophthora fragariae]KAE8928972.1 hypothetical protein PF009_g20906 [Phytophthora fragariae]KAE9082074.1 hypothetical protein PF007_g22414 [Phytophthora fragariae]KAE9083232.1 hypothetical protein PF006_g26728 [Phytophthora fragariae]KAE9175463.1 hypothetical protein PF005_g25393 [Phytophthora fragariae]
MKLTEGEGYLLLSPQFTQRLKYVEKLNAKNPTNGTSVVSTLTAYYGETGLYRLIEAGIKNRKTEDLATKLQAEKIQHWVVKAKGPDDVFRVMALDIVHKDSILSNPGFSTWAKYVDAFNAKYPEHPTSMIPTLLNYFSDVALFKLIEVAEIVMGTKSIATKLQEKMSKIG